MLYGHGDDFYLFNKKIRGNFSSNVFPGGVNPLLTNFLKKYIKIIENYPEVLAESFVKKLSDYFGLPENYFLISNGAIEAIYTIAHAFTGKSSFIRTPTFAEYEDACALNNHKITFSKKLIFQKNQDLVWICNPNNPDGSCIDKESILKIITKNKNTVFIIDEAYIDFTKEIASLIDLIDKFDNLILIRSMTKVFGIPGLRLGFIVGKKVAFIKKYKLPWSVNSLAISAGNFIFENYENVFPNINNLLENKKILATELEKIHWLEPVFSDTSFFLVKLKKWNSKLLKKYLIENYGLLIRNAENFRGLNDTFIRISSQDYKINYLLIDALKNVHF